MRFGLMQAKLGIVKILMNFKLSPCDKTAIPMKYKPSSPSMAPLGGVWLKVEKI